MLPCIKSETNKAFEVVSISKHLKGRFGKVCPSVLSLSVSHNFQSCATTSFGRLRTLNLFSKLKQKIIVSFPFYDHQRVTICIAGPLFHNCALFPKRCGEMTMRGKTLLTWDSFVRKSKVTTDRRNISSASHKLCFLPHWHILKCKQ